MEVVQPKVLVCLGVTAAQSVLGRVVSIGRERGKFFAGKLGPAVFVTVHPSSIFRRRDEAECEDEYHQFLADLRKVQHKLATAWFDKNSISVHPSGIRVAMPRAV